MNIRFIIYFIISSIILLQTACGPKEDPAPYYTLSDEFKSYCFFNDGSSWEYKSSLLPTNDVVAIGGHMENVWTNTFEEIYNYQAVDMYVLDNQIGISMIELTAGSTINAVTSMNSQMWLFFDNGDYRLIFAPQYPLGEEQLLGEHEGNYTNVEIIPAMSLGQKTYLDVYHTRVIDYFEQGYGNFHFYIAKNYGLVKMENIMNNDTIIIELIDSSLYQ